MTTLARLLSTLTLLLGLHSPATLAGKLDDFEHKATKQKPTTTTTRHKTDHQTNHQTRLNTSTPCGYSLFKCLFQDLLLHATNAAFSGVRPAANEQIDTLPLSGAMPSTIPLKPTLQLDIAYQPPRQQISAYDIRLELGSGPVGAQARVTHYKETNPSDHMNLFHLHGLARLIKSNDFGFNLGLGISQLNGNNQTSGISFTLPMSWYVSSGVAIEFKPTLFQLHDTLLSDIDSSLVFITEAGNLNLGYRSINSRDVTISGPYLGLSIRY